MCHRQVQPLMGAAYRYDGAWQAVQALLSQRSLAAGLMRGYWATNAVWLPWNAIYIACYEESKRMAAASLGRRSGGLRGPAGDGFAADLQRNSVAALPGWAVAGCAAGVRDNCRFFDTPCRRCEDTPAGELVYPGGQWHEDSGDWQALTRLPFCCQVLSATQQGSETTAMQLARELYRSQGASRP